ncbi:brevican core protein isoform 2-T3 [Discoglossus pictus]
MSRNLALLLMLASLTLNSAWEEHPESQKALKVTIRSPPTMPVLSGTLTIPCHISKQWPLEETSVGRQAVLATPRVKWSFISSGKEMEILVARGHKVKINEAYRYRASMPNYSTSADDVTLVLRELRSNDSGVYRCHVQHGIEDDLDMLEVKVKGVVFLYREGTARYAYTFSMAQEACAKIRAHIATADQLLAAYQSGYEQCDAGWIADQTVRYPIQTPREGCYGDMDGYPGVRNYGVLEPDDLYDVYCYVEELNGEVFLDSRPDKFTLEEAKTYCRSLGATVATTGQLYAAWNDGLDSCSPGWLSDGSVRYPIVTPRERCGGNSPGVKTIFQFRNQTGFPDSKAKYDVYCFREKGPYRTQGSEDDRTAPVGAIITVTESFKELKFSEVKGENEAQGSVDTIPLFTTGETGLGDDQTATPSANTSIAVEKDASPPSLESAVSHKELSQSDLEEHVNSEEEDSYQDFREEDLPMEFTTEPSLGQALEDKLGSFPENQSVSSLQEMNGRILEGSVEPPTEFTTDACFPNPCENGGTCMEEDHGDVTCLCLPGYFGKLCDINTEKCLDDWDTFQGYCYKHFHTRKSWEEAETHCRDYGGHLASIMTPEEQDFINNQYREYQWTGLNDRTIEGDFQWSDGNPLLFESWNNGQPDSYFLSGENCVIMVWHDGGRWSDVPCNYHLPYTCKMGLVSCGSPPEVANATTYGKPKMRYQISSVVGYRCDDGFLQRNSPIIKCQTDGMWEEPQINCIPTSQ